MTPVNIVSIQVSFIFCHMAKWMHNYYVWHNYVHVNLFKVSNYSDNNILSCDVIATVCLQ